MDCSTAPVFVVGCPRSGTTYLYHLLLSAGGFANYRSETHAFDVIGPKFNHLRRRSDVERFLTKWLPGKMCNRTGIDKEILRKRLLDQCRSPAAFLQIVMQSIAESQAVNRWAECTPENALYLREINKEFPSARVLHIIRDGRDVALSMVRQRWIAPLPLHTEGEFVASLLYWRWIVTMARIAGRTMPENYREIHYEELVTNPVQTINEIAAFINHDMDYRQIQKNAIGSVSRPNSSFQTAPTSESINRWKLQSSSDQQILAQILAGELSTALGYEAGCQGGPWWKNRFLRAVADTYGAWCSAKLWAKHHALGMLVDPHLIEEEGE